MGEAKRRGTYDERVAMAKHKEAERERLWKEKQETRRRERLEAEAHGIWDLAKSGARPVRGRSRLVLAAALAMSSAALVTTK